MSDHDQESKNIQELKYEGLAALIVQGQKTAERQHDEFVSFVDHRFNAIDKHNKDQNHTTSKAIARIGELEKEIHTRKLTCMSAVEILQKKTKYVGLLEWINKNQKKSAIGGLLLMLATFSIILRAHEHGWSSQVLEYIKLIF